MSDAPQETIAVAKLLKATISLFDTVKAAGVKPRTITVGKYFSRTKTGFWKSKVEAARQLHKHPQPSLERFTKEYLPAVKPSGLFGGLADATLSRHSRILCLDLDASKNPGVDLFAARQAVQDDKHVLGLHVSAGGAGIAVFVAVAARDALTHKQCFRAASGHFEDKHGLRADPLCSNVGRNRYVSFDGACWWRAAGEVVPFQPLLEALVDPPGCGNRSNDTCGIRERGNLSSLSPSGGLGGIGSDQPEPLSGHPNTPLSPLPAADEDEPGDTSAPPVEWPPAVVRIYDRWLGHITPSVGSRNATMVGRVPILLSVVGRKVVRLFMVRFHNQHSAIFSDYPLAEFERQVVAHIAACVLSYVDNGKVGLNEAERACYLSIKDRENLSDAFRICRGLARSKVNSGKPFSLAGKHLGLRLRCHREVAARQLEYLEKLGAIKTAKRGKEWKKGQQSVSSTYRWMFT